MKKIYIALILGIIFLVGTVYALTEKKVFAFGLEKEDFTEKVDKIKTDKICEKLGEKKDKYKKCKNNEDVDVTGDFISRNGEGVIMIE